MTSHLATTVATLCAAAMLAACTSPKPPPGWPDGTERPINANVPAAQLAKPGSAK